MNTNPTPIIEQHDGVTIACDHLLLGGTKTRYLPLLFEGTKELVYASSCQGGGQVAVAHVAKKLGKKATILAAQRAQPHRRQFEAMVLGANYLWVKCGYQNVLEANAKKYCLETGARLAPFGLGQTDDCLDIVTEAARKTGLKPVHVWVGAGSGATCRALAHAWPRATIHAVQCGHSLTSEDVAGAAVHVFPRPYKWEAPADECPLPVDPVYEIKAWKTMLEWRDRVKPRGTVLFWSVMSSPKI
jgi:1-aminocyclopropane-1-carboxylate deaminase/D-cysteine desulfhydrase-like pyridoxal-dependent ACC family enzyme